MRTLMAECYAILFKLTRAKLFSYWFGLTYLAILSFWVINGLSKLMIGWLPFASLIQKLFGFPYYLGTAAILFGLIYKFSPDVKQLSKDSKKKGSYVTLILFSVSVILLIVYMKLGDAIFT